MSNPSSVQVIFNAEHVVRIRVLMLTTALRPFEGIADLYMVDPDGFVIRKWNSKGRLESEQGVLPMYLVNLVRSVEHPKSSQIVNPTKVFEPMRHRVRAMSNEQT